MHSTRITAFFLLVLSLGIAATAAYFSIAGLAELFAATVIPVIIMMGTLEAAKLGATFYVHRYWPDLPIWKWLIAMMIVILMAITSMGIFGFLSKGYLGQEAPLSDFRIKIERVDERIVVFQNQINRQNTRIKRSNDSIEKLDGIVQKLIKFDRIRGRDGANTVLKNQNSQRLALDNTINTANDKIDGLYGKIDSLNAEKTEYRSSTSKVEAKLGPIKYVAELFGFDLNQSDGKGRAVRLLIIMLMIAFDPLAIVLIMAFDWTLLRAAAERKAMKEEREEDETVKETPQPEPEQDDMPDVTGLSKHQDEERPKEDCINIPVPEIIEDTTRAQFSPLEGGPTDVYKHTKDATSHEEGIQKEKSVPDLLPKLLIENMNDDIMTDEQLVQYIRSNEDIFKQLIYIRDISTTASTEDRSIAEELLGKVEQIALNEIKKQEEKKLNTNEWLTGFSGKR